MSKLSEIRPTQRQRLIDLVAAAGIDVSDWSNFSGSENMVAANPKYCYEWSFINPKKLVVLNLWHDGMEEHDGTISISLNPRQFASRRHGVERVRALKMDKAIQTAIQDRLPIRVIALGGRRRNINNSGEKASHVSKRLLDPVSWTITKYNWETGQCMLARGIYELNVSNTESENAIDDLADVPEGNIFPDRAKGIVNSIKRDNKVRSYVLKRAKGKCEHCSALGFSMSNGGRYLETHHIIALGNSGPDTVYNVIALCPEHHRQAHYGINAEPLEKEFMAKLKELNKVFSQK